MPGQSVRREISTFLMVGVAEGAVVGTKSIRYIKFTGGCKLSSQIDPYH